MAARQGGAPHRVRITVPAADEVVLAWMDAQPNVSVAIRALVQQEVATHGVRDFFSRSLADLGQAAPVAAVRPRADQTEADRAATTRAGRTGAPAGDGPLDDAGAGLEELAPEPVAAREEPTAPPVAAPVSAPAPRPAPAADPAASRGSTAGMSGVGDFFAATRDDD